MGAVTTSLVIQFADEAASSLYLTAEVDSRETADGGYNGGSTSFRPGDSPAFLVFRDPSLSLTFTPTSGSVSPLGQGTMQVDEFITIANSRSATLSKLPNSAPSLSVVAGSAPGMIYSGSTSVSTTEDCTCVIRAVYTTTFDAYRLSGVPLTLDGMSDFPVVVVIIGTSA